MRVKERAGKRLIEKRRRNEMKENGTQFKDGRRVERKETETKRKRKRKQGKSGLSGTLKSSSSVRINNCVSWVWRKKKRLKASTHTPLLIYASFSFHSKTHCDLMCGVRSYS